MRASLHASRPLVRAVLLDIDDTLFPSSEFAAQARQNAIRAMIQAGLKASPAQAERELGRIVKQKGSNFCGHFDLLSKRFPSPDRYRVIAAGVGAYHNTKSSISPYPEAARTLLALRERGYVLAVASEGVAVKQWDKLIRLGLDPLFHRVFVTSSIGSGKTPAFYKRIARELRLPPAAILMVGDNPVKDIEPARSAGMLTARLRRGKHARESDSASLRLRTLADLARRLPAHPSA